jgi:hypothetical protein
MEREQQRRRPHPLKHNQGSVHGPDGPANPALLNAYIDQGATSPDATVGLGDSFHTYAVEWLPGEVDFYIDGALYGRRSPALLDPNYIWELDTIDSGTPRTEYPILNLEVGTVHGGDDFPVTTGTIQTPNPLDMTVDYVRRYTYAMASRTLPAFYGNVDLGGPGPNSDASYASGTFTITGVGNGIDLTAGSSSHLPNDQLHYVYRSLTADGTYIVKVGSQSSTLSTAGAGLMIRDGRAAYAQFVTTWIAKDGTVHFQSRVLQTANDATFGSCGPWLRIIKSGTSFIGGCFTDGTTWTTTSTATVTFSNHELSGLIAFPGGNPIGPSFADVLNTVTFTNLSVPAGRAAWDGNPPVIPTPAYKNVVPATLIQAENFDVGGQGSAYNTTLASNTSGQYRPDENISIDLTSDYTTADATVSGYMVDYTVQGQWMNYTVNVATAGTYTISTRVASDGAGGTFHLNLDGTQASSEMTVPDTGGWDTWQTCSSSITFPTTGIHTIGLAMDTVGSATQYAGNFDLFTIK